MSEYQPNYYDTYMVESIYPYSIDIPETITKMSREITRNATLLIRLLNLLREEGVRISDLEYTLIRLTKRLKNLLKLLDIYHKADEEEYNTLSAELDNALLERDALHIKIKINEICDEEYSLKLSVANWTIEDLRAKKNNLEKGIDALENLKGLTEFRDVDDLYQISKNNYHSLNSLELEPYTRELLINTLSKILERVTYSGPSTL
jgi:hypothetical protein